MRLAVPHFSQRQPHTCLPACVRMILAYWGKEHTEAELAKACGTVPLLGTRPESVIVGLESLGYHALWFENATVERLLELLANDLPVIVFLRAGDLPHGRAGVHAAVVVDIEGDQVTCLDPALDHAERLGLPPFLKAWSSLGHQGLVVWV